MAASSTDSPPAQSALSFTQGFLLGQLSITLFIFAFIKFFIFGEAPPSDVRASRRAEIRHRRTLSYQQRHSIVKSANQTSVSSLLNSHDHPTREWQQDPQQLQRGQSQRQQKPAPPPIDAATILSKTFYNVSGHQPESLDWFNVLIAQAIAQLRADAQQDGVVLKSLTELMNGPSRPEYVGEISVTELSLGDDFPIFSNCRIIPVVGNSNNRAKGTGLDGIGGGLGGARAAAAAVLGAEGRLQAQMDVDLSDVITLGVETTLVLNYPKPVVAVLPVALSVSVVRFSGTLTLSFNPSSSPNDNTATAPVPPTPTLPSPSTSSPTMLTFTFLDDYRLDLSVRSLLGSRSRLQDVPKIAQLVESRLHAWFDERCVEPRFQQIVLPSLWPRKKNTGGPGDEQQEGSSEDGDDDGSRDGGEGRKPGDGVTGGVAVPAPRSPEGVRRRVRTESSSIMPGSMDME